MTAILATTKMQVHLDLILPESIGTVTSMLGCRWWNAAPVVGYCWGGWGDTWVNLWHVPRQLGDEVEGSKLATGRGHAIYNCYLSFWRETPKAREPLF
jgi:hypothetical protein